LPIRIIQRSPLVSRWHVFWFCLDSDVQNFEESHCSVNGLSVDILEVRYTIGTAVRMLHLTVPVLRGFTLLLRKGKTTFHHPQRKIPIYTTGP